MIRLNIALIGYRGCGKTTIGKILSKKLKMKFVDLDYFIEKKLNKKIERIFEEEGENKFREYEKSVLNDVLKEDNQVIACGGGIVKLKENMQKISKSCLIIYLEVPVKILIKRNKKGKRPRLIKDVSLEHEIRKMLKIRKPLYEKYCTIKVRNVGKKQRCVNKIIKKIKRYL